LDNTNIIRKSIDDYLQQLSDRIDSKVDITYPPQHFINSQQVHHRLCLLLDIHIGTLNLMQEVFAMRQHFNVQIATIGGSPIGQSLTRRVGSLKEAEFILKDKLKVLELQIETMRSFFSAMVNADGFHADFSGFAEKTTLTP